jgi:hypothetical protein
MTLETCSRCGIEARTLEGDRVKVVKDDFLQLLVHLLLLTNNDITLAFNGAALELRVLKDVRDDVDRLPHVLAEGLRVVNRLFPASVCIQVGAKVLDLKFESVLRALAGALERHVFEKVRSAVRLVRLCARASVNPDAHGGRLRRRVRLRRDGQTVGKGRDLSDWARHAGRCRERAQRALDDTMRNVPQLVELASTYRTARTARRRTETTAEGGGQHSRRLKVFDAGEGEVCELSWRAFGGSEPGRGRVRAPVC